MEGNSASNKNVHTLYDYFKEKANPEADLIEIRYYKDDIEEYYNIFIKIAVYGNLGAELYGCYFYGVTGLALKNLSESVFPDDIEITDNSENGYSAEMRYCLREIEDGSISFYFRDLHIKKL